MSETREKPTHFSYNKVNFISERSSKPKCFPFPFQLNHALFGVEIWQETILYYPYVVAGLISLAFFDRWMSSWALNIFSSADSKGSFVSWFPWLWVLMFINFSMIYNSNFFLTMLQATSCLLAWLMRIIKYHLIFVVSLFQTIRGYFKLPVIDMIELISTAYHGPYFASLPSIFLHSSRFRQLFKTSI